MYKKAVSDPFVFDQNSRPLACTGRVSPTPRHWPRHQTPRSGPVASLWGSGRRSPRHQRKGSDLVEERTPKARAFPCLFLCFSYVSWGRKRTSIYMGGSLCMCMFNPGDPQSTRVMAGRGWSGRGLCSFIPICWWLKPCIFRFLAASFPRPPGHGWVATGLRRCSSCLYSGSAAAKTRSRRPKTDVRRSASEKK